MSRIKTLLPLPLLDTVTWLVLRDSLPLTCFGFDDPPCDAAPRFMGLAPGEDVEESVSPVNSSSLQPRLSVGDRVLAIEAKEEAGESSGGWFWAADLLVALGLEMGD